MQTATETHRARAAEIAAAAPLVLPVAQHCARQGDVILRRVRDLTPAEQADAAGADALLLLAAGAHGSHFLAGPALALGPDTYAVAPNAAVVHTDEPAARHASFALGSGVWQCAKQTELRGDQIVEVRD